MMTKRNVKMIMKAIQKLDPKVGSIAVSLFTNSEQGDGNAIYPKVFYLKRKDVLNQINSTKVILDISPEYPSSKQGNTQKQLLQG